MKKVALVCLWLVIAPFAHALLKAEVDATTISVADTIRLTVRADTTNPTGTPNIDAVHADFDVLSTQTSSQFRSINGHVDAWTIWTYFLKPKHDGTLQIPALTVGAEQSQPISITVRELDPQLRRAISETVFFETDHTPDRVYVQSQVVVSRKLFYASGAQLYGEMPEVPEIPGALVRPLGEPQQTTVMRDGRQYGLIEQRFAVFPEQSGELEIPKASVTGSIRLGTGSRRVGADVSSEALTIHVLPIPAEYPQDAPWLPATQVELLEDWPGDPAHGLAVGAASQRTLIVRVDGNTASVIPPLPTSVPASMKAYPETPRLNEVPTAGGIVGTRTETTSLVATAPGSVTLPEVSLTWWDTVNQQVKRTSVPARMVTVTGTAATPPAERPGETAAAPTADSAQPAAAPAAAISASLPAKSDFTIWYVVTAFIVFAASVFALHRWRGPRRVTPKNVELPAYRALARSCSSNDPARIRAALDDWLVAHYALPISAAAAHFARASAARDAINALNARLYKHGLNETFDAAALRACVDAERSRKLERISAEWPALYPSA